MALEAVVFSQDPLTSYNYLREYYNLYEYNTNTASTNFGFSNNNYDYYSNNSNTSPSEINHNQNDVVTGQWDHDHHQYINNNNVNSSPEAGHCTMEQYLSGEAAPPLMEGSPVADVGGCGGGSGRRKRRRRSCKNKEEVEQQRMTHIAVERNRRKQMNDYLSVIRSLMPPSYAQRGDQASIVGGAINYVKELEQLCQSLEGHKRTKQEQGQHSSQDDDDVASSEAAALFADFFSFPQYSNRSPATENQSPAASGGGCSRKSAVGEVEVTVVESHANVKILAKKEGKQLLRLVAGFQGLRLSVLHLNVTTVDSFALYSFSVKIEEGCQLNSVDDIAAAANHILTQIQEDAVTLL